MTRWGLNDNDYVWCHYYLYMIHALVARCPSHKPLNYFRLMWKLYKSNILYLVLVTRYMGIDSHVTDCAHGVELGKEGQSFIKMNSCGALIIGHHLHREYIYIKVNPEMLNCAVSIGMENKCSKYTNGEPLFSYNQ